MPSDDEYLGFLKYEGSKVEDGFLDASASARALLGLDFALRYLISLESPQFGETEFPIPVRIRRGSWEAIVPQNIEGWLGTAGGLSVTAYLATAGKKAAENDFSKVGVKELFVPAFKAIQWLIEIGKHLGSFAYREVTSPKWSKNNTEIGIPDINGEYLYVPTKYFEIYAKCPLKLLSDMSSVVDSNCELSVGTEGSLKITVHHT